MKTLTPSKKIIPQPCLKVGEGMAPSSREITQYLVALDDALNSLARIDERKSRIVELRFFGGLSVEETASMLKDSPPDHSARLATGQILAFAWTRRKDQL